MMVSEYERVLRYEEAIMAGDHYGDHIYHRIVYYQWDKLKVELFEIDRDCNMILGASDNICVFLDY
jgi:hypothetical protein